MGLKFSCPSCGKAIIGRYLIIDDQLRCPHCHGHIIIPRNMTVTNEKPNIIKSDNFKSQKI